MSKDTIFTKIINREVPAMIAYEDDVYIAFADINPRANGHLLVVPKTVCNQFTEMSVDEFSSLMALSHKIANALQKATSVERIELGIVGEDVPHVHVHLIPFNVGDNHSEKEFDKEKTQQIIDQLKLA